MHNHLAATPYIQNLESNREQFRAVIDDLLKEFKVQPVGDGYIDLIVGRDRSLQLIDELAKQAIAIQSLTWWCLCTPESKIQLGCPHGMGGPINEFGEGWFSECIGIPDFVVAEQRSSIDEVTMGPGIFASECSILVAGYINNVLPNEGFYSPCLHLGLWLHVPDDWRRKDYLV